MRYSQRHNTSFLQGHRIGFLLPRNKQPRSSLPRADSRAHSLLCISGPLSRRMSRIDFRSTRYEGITPSRLNFVVATGAATNTPAGSDDQKESAHWSVLRINRAHPKEQSPNPIASRADNVGNPHHTTPLQTPRPRRRIHPEPHLMEWNASVSFVIIMCIKRKYNLHPQDLSEQRISCRRERIKQSKQ